MKEWLIHHLSRGALLVEDLLKSKRFWLAAASLLAIVLKEWLPFTEEQIQAGVIVLASWIVGDSLRATNPDKDPRSVQSLYGVDDL